MIQMRLALTEWRKLQSLAMALPILALAAGCASKIDPQRDNAALETPAIFSSAALTLATNTLGFTANVEIQSPSSLGTKRQTGRVFGAGSRFMFVPDFETHVFRKEAAADKTYFVWDVAESKGYVLNEALQGYAPYSIPARVTNVTVDDVESVSADFDGHRCRRGEATISVSEGPQATFTVWRAKDLNGFPMQIKAGSGQYTVTFSKVNFERVGGSLFTPPEGFTQHPSPSAMLGILLERQDKARKKSDDLPEGGVDTAPQISRDHVPQY